MSRRFVYSTSAGSPSIIRADSTLIRKIQLFSFPQLMLSQSLFPVSLADIIRSSSLVNYSLDSFKTVHIPPLQGLDAGPVVSIDIPPLRGCEWMPLGLFFYEFRTFTEHVQKTHAFVRIRGPNPYNTVSLVGGGFPAPLENCPNYRLG